MNYRRLTHWTMHNPQTGDTRRVLARKFWYYFRLGYRPLEVKR